jgi:hypothetical protein
MSQMTVTVVMTVLRVRKKVPTAGHNRHALMSMRNVVF